MLGLRGVRLGLMLKDLYRMQARAATTALTRRIQAGGTPHLEIMIPLVAAAEELIRMREMIEEEIAAATAGVRCGIGHPDRDDDRAAPGRPDRRRDRRSCRLLLLRHQRPDPDDIRPESRRCRGLFLRDYLEQGIFTSRPVPDSRPGRGGASGPGGHQGGAGGQRDLVVGLCGEHGGDPDSDRLRPLSSASTTCRAALPVSRGPGSPQPRRLSSRTATTSESADHVDQLGHSLP